MSVHSANEDSRIEPDCIDTKSKNMIINREAGARNRFSCRSRRIRPEVDLDMALDSC